MMRKQTFSRLLIAIVLACGYSSTSAQATSITVGAPLPELTIDERGELMLNGDDFAYTPWRNPGGIGKVHVLQYMAGTLKARSQTRPFTDQLQENLPLGSYHVTTVINLDDVLWGTTGFVVGEVKDSKRKYPDSTIVLDEEGSGLDTWQLKPKGATIVVLDPGGSVLFLKQGAMSEQEIENTLNLIRQHISERSS
ncbi:MAG: YtfJ family protein [Halieaceae bacterium]